MSSAAGKLCQVAAAAAAGVAGGWLVYQPWLEARSKENQALEEERRKQRDGRTRIVPEGA